MNGWMRMSEDVSDELLRMLVCPQTHAKLVRSGDWLYSTDRETRKKYPIRDGIPVMLIDEADVADDAEFARVMAETNEDGQLDND